MRVCYNKDHIRIMKIQFLFPISSMPCSIILWKMRQSTTLEYHSNNLMPKCLLTNVLVKHIGNSQWSTTVDNLISGKHRAENSLILVITDLYRVYCKCFARKNYISFFAFHHWSLLFMHFVNAESGYAHPGCSEYTFEVTYVMHTFHLSHSLTTSIPNRLD